jgi:hypothetical protein
VLRSFWVIGVLCLGTILGALGFVVGGKGHLVEFGESEKNRLLTNLFAKFA